MSLFNEQQPVPKKNIEREDYLLELYNMYKGKQIDTTQDEEADELKQVMMDIKDLIMNREIYELPYSVTYLTHEEDSQAPYCIEAFKIHLDSKVFYMYSIIYLDSFSSFVTISDESPFTF